MSNDGEPRDRPVSSDLHPLVYGLIIGFVMWFVLAVWSFAAGEDTDYLLVVVSGFILMAVGLPCVLWRVGLKGRDADAKADDATSFPHWASNDFDTWQDRLPGANAAVEILLPIGAAALGMTAFGIVFHLVAHGAV